MEEKIHIIVGVLSGYVDSIEATLDAVVAEATYQRFCEEYGYDPEHAESCENDVGTIIITFSTDDLPAQQPVEVYELEE